MPPYVSKLYIVKVEPDETDSAGSTTNVYSEDEVRIGTWFGLPLYRKSYHYRIPNTGILSGFPIMTYDEDMHVVHQTTRILRDDGFLMEDFSATTDAAGLSGTIEAKPDEHLIWLYCGSTIFTHIGNRPAVTILEYTKTPYDWETIT